MPSKKLALPMVALAAVPVVTGCTSANDSPNIIVIMVDDMGFSDLACYGGEVQTPNLDHLAEEGIRFTNFYNTSRSCPTRASLLTGLYAHQAGIGRMNSDSGLPAYRGTLSRNAVTIAEVLGEAGYNTAMVGKWHVTETIQLEDPAEHTAWVNHQEVHDSFADRSNYPVNRGFDSYFGIIGGSADYFDPFGLVEGEEPVTEVPEDFYTTVAFSERAAADIDRMSQEDAPFFLYLAYNAPHWPLHALPEDIEKYKNVYTVGWEAVRNARYEKQVEMGLFGNQEDFLSKRQFDDLWEENPTAAWDAMAMACHAAMVDRVDQGIGLVLEALERNGELDNTLILFLSDNGCCAETVQNWIPGVATRPSMTRDGREVIYPKNKEAMPGPQTVFSSVGQAWANVSNTPFRLWKAKTYEGGICTPMIAYWPKGIKKSLRGSLNTSQGHVMDIMATCIDLADTEYPNTYNGYEIIPMEGLSLDPVFKTGTRKGHDYIGFEHFYQRALIRDDGWKIVRPGNKADWELYDLNNDRSEKHNLAGEHPEILREMVAVYQDWAIRCQVEPYPERSSSNKKGVR